MIILLYYFCSIIIILLLIRGPNCENDPWLTTKTDPPEEVADPQNMNPDPLGSSPGEEELTTNQDPNKKHMTMTPQIFETLWAQTWAGPREEEQSE